ncbi:FG-GAP-like repeat-containing protein [uncultured Maribacter sp.]|uniref:FG-GAP-like repeat-containing protein n=1 Tax=uncultured Maribacter sp. TaxID=431308 RepID=UPI002627AC59|nr:FG-GAP-like repeat-containing protein [uncultured Maribacter sp.]
MIAKQLNMLIRFCCFLTLLGFNLEGYSQVFSEVESFVFSGMNANYGNAVADYDQDGDLDIFIVAYNSYDANDGTTISRLLENKRGFFEDVTDKVGLRKQHSINNSQDFKLGVSWGDYNNDGYPDLILAHQNGTQLFENQEGKRFRDVSSIANINPCTDNCINSGNMWWDYDKDGDLDLYLYYLDSPNRLLQNQGNSTFLEIENALNLNDSNRTWSCLPIDVNRDGWMDLYVVNDFGLSRFYLSIEGNSFEEATQEYNLINTGCGMGSTIGDYNNDGFFDIYVTNIAESKDNPLFMGTEEGPFINTTVEEGVANGHYGWGTRFLDVDNDGDQDLYVVNGDNDLHYNNVLFKNVREEGGNGFQDWSQLSSANGISNGMGAEVFDMDLDGDQDILVSNTNASPYLYKNNTASPNAWLQVNLEGTVSNRNAFGAVVIAYVQDRAIHRLVYGTSILSQSVKPVHLGLGKVQKVDSLIVQWPNSKNEVIKEIAVNQKIKLVEQQGMLEGEIFVAKEEEQETEIESTVEELPFDLRIYPNPFKDSVEFLFDEKITSGLLRMDIYSIIGVKVFQLEQEITPNLDWTLHWKGENSRGVKLTSGMYFYKIKIDNKKWSGSMLLR